MEGNFLTSEPSRKFVIAKLQICNVPKNGKNPRTKVSARIPSTEEYLRCSNEVSGRLASSGNK